MWVEADPDLTVISRELLRFIGPVFTCLHLQERRSVEEEKELQYVVSLHNSWAC